MSRGRFGAQLRHPVLWVVVAAILWGFSALAAEELFRNHGVAALWLVAARVIGTAVLLALFVGPARTRRALGRLTARRGEAVRIALFGVVALDGVQLTFFLAVQHGNAITATLLQFTSPLFILALVSFTSRRAPAATLAVTVVAAVAGVILVVTGGTFTQLHIPLAGLAWGVLCALFTAAYNLAPGPMLARHDPNLVVAGAFLAGGAVLLPSLVTAAPRHMDASGIALVAFVVVGGTAVPFLLYLSALSRVDALSANVVGTLEPLAAAAGSVALLGTRITWALGLGVVLVLGAITAVSVSRARERAAS
ncbi:MAG: DMT family transporter [Actinomycetota bacterium]|nr:DMT family transporter [Actinomycetota bacterium]